MPSALPAALACLTGQPYFVTWQGGDDLAQSTSASKSCRDQPAVYLAEPAVVEQVCGAVADKNRASAPRRGEPGLRAPETRSEGPRGPGGHSGSRIDRNQDLPATPGHRVATLLQGVKPAGRAQPRDSTGLAPAPQGGGDGVDAG